MPNATAKHVVRSPAAEGRKLPPLAIEPHRVAKGFSASMYRIGTVTVKPPADLEKALIRSSISLNTLTRYFSGIIFLQPGRKP